VTEAGEAVFALATVLTPYAEAGAETWQEDTTVAVTLKEAVAVAARAGLEARADARKPKASAKVIYFIDFAFF
jgi:hypothetical protein